MTFADCTKGTPDPKLYVSLVRNPTYEIPIPSGYYDVTIFASEEEYNNLQSRIWHLFLEETDMVRLSICVSSWPLTSCLLG